MIVDKEPRSKIQSFVFTEPMIRPNHFIPERDLSESDWEIMYRDLEIRRSTLGKADDSNFLWNAAKIKTLFPKRVNRLRLKDEALVLDAVSCINDAKAKSLSWDWSTFLAHASGAKLLYPEEDNTIDFSFLKESRQQDSLVNFFARKSADEAVENVLHFVILYPNERDKILSKSIANAFTEKINSCYDSSEVFSKDSVIKFAKYNSGLRLLFPELFSERGVRKDEWLGMHEFLDNFRITIDKSNLPNELRAFTALFSDFAFYMAILAADEAYIDEKGLHLLNSKTQIEESKNNMPVIRNF